MKARRGISPFLQFIFIEAFLTDPYTYFERQSCGRGKQGFSLSTQRTEIYGGNQGLLHKSRTLVEHPRIFFDFHFPCVQYFFLF